MNCPPYCPPKIEKGDPQTTFTKQTMEVNLYLKDVNSQNETPIYARIYYHPVSFKYYLNEKIKPNKWDNKQGKVIEAKGASAKLYIELNAKLQNAVRDIQETFRRYLNDNQNHQPSKVQFKHLLDLHFKRIVPVIQPEQVRLRVQDFFSDFIKRCEEGTRVQIKTSKPITENTIKTYRTAQKHLLSYQQKHQVTLHFEDIDLVFYESFKSYLMKDLQFSNNSTGKHIQLLKAVIADAFELGIHKNQIFLKKGFAGLREDTDSIYLSEYEINEIQNLDLSENPHLEATRDYFLLGCWTGVRYSDYNQIVPNRITNNIIQIKQTKTHQLTAIPINSKVQSIFKKYNNTLPRLISNQKTNKGLKTLCKMVESLRSEVLISYTRGGLRFEEYHPKWSLVSTHTARRSFATNRYLEGVPSKTIMAITGHRTEMAFFKYIKLHQTDHANIMLQHMMKTA